MTALRVILGLLTYVVVSYILGLILPSPAGMVGTAASAALTAFLGALLGMLVARSHFLLPVFALWTAAWAYLAYVLYMVALPTGNPLSFLHLLEQNWLPLLASALALLAGWSIARSIIRSQSVRAAA